jgi:hypothetical protein
MHCTIVMRCGCILRGHAEHLEWLSWRDCLAGGLLLLLIQQRCIEAVAIHFRSASDFQPPNVSLSVVVCMPITRTVHALVITSLIESTSITSYICFTANSNATREEDVVSFIARVPLRFTTGLILDGA